jgi:hypothetical protein
MLSVEAGTTAHDAGKGSETRGFRTIRANIIASQFRPQYFSEAFARNLLPMARKPARIRKVRPVPKSRRIDVTQSSIGSSIC